MDRWLHKGRLWAEWTFRGHNLGVYEFDRDLDRSDWRLIHKHEESELFQSKEKMPPIDIPESFPLPPLQVYTGNNFLMEFLALHFGFRNYWPKRMPRKKEYAGLPRMSVRLWTFVLILNSNFSSRSFERWNPQLLTAQFTQKPIHMFIWIYMARYGIIWLDHRSNDDRIYDGINILR